MALSDVKYTVTVFTSQEEEGDTVSGNSLPGVVSLLIKPTEGWTIAASDFVLGTPLATEVSSASFTDSIGPYEIGNEVTCKVIFNDWTMPAADKKITVDIDTVNGPKPIEDQDDGEPTAYDVTAFVLYKFEEVPGIGTANVLFTPSTGVGSDAIVTNIGGQQDVQGFKVTASDLTPFVAFNLGSLRIRTSAPLAFRRPPVLITNPYGSLLPLDAMFFWLQTAAVSDVDGEYTSFSYDLFYKPIQDVTPEDQAAILIQGAVVETSSLDDLITGMVTGPEPISSQGEKRIVKVRAKQGATYDFNVYSTSGGALAGSVFPGGARSVVVKGSSKFSDRGGENTFLVEIPAGTNETWNFEVTPTGTTTLSSIMGAGKQSLFQPPTTTVRFSQTVGVTGWTVTGGADIDIIGLPMTDDVIGGDNLPQSRNVRLEYTVTNGGGLTLDRQPVFDNTGGSSDWSNSDANSNGHTTGTGYGSIVTMKNVRATSIGPNEIFVEADATIQYFGTTTSGLIEFELDITNFIS